MNRSRDFSWLIRPVAVAGLILFGALLLGAQPSTAAPIAPVGPTEIAPPTVVTLPPKPEPCVKKCVPPTLEPCFALPGHPCTQPPTLAPCTVNPDACKPPTTTTTPTTPTVITSTPPVTTKHPSTPSDPPPAIPTPNRIDTGGGPAESAPTALFWVIPALAVLILVAGAGGFWLARSERRR